SQERALEELATTLALVEAWVDHVTTQALVGKLPQLEALREVLRRRRASGAPAEQMLARTVGIELLPRRVREALAWWDSVLATEGDQGREAKWDHPDLLPTAEVLSGRPQAPQSAAADSPDALADVEIPTDFDAELERLLRGVDTEGGGSEDSGSEDSGAEGDDGADGTDGEGGTGGPDSGTDGDRGDRPD